MLWKSILLILTAMACGKTKQITERSSNSAQFEDAIAGDHPMPEEGLQQPETLDPALAAKFDAGIENYGKYCQSCHLDLVSTNLKPNTTAPTMRAMISNKAAMASVAANPAVTDEVLETIALVLELPEAPSADDAQEPEHPMEEYLNPDPVDPGIASGEEGFKAHCQSCHVGPLRDRILGATVTDIARAIAEVDSMKSLATLNAQLVANISSYLGGQTPPPQGVPGDNDPAPAPPLSTAERGASLYKDRCQTCHGPLAGTTIPVAMRGASALEHALAERAPMAAIFAAAPVSPLGIADVAAALALVVTTPPPADGDGTDSPDDDQLSGAELYARSCQAAGCHGPITSSNKRGITLADLDNAIANPARPMGHLDSLSLEERRRIVDALATSDGDDGSGTGGDGPPVDPNATGRDLYAANCQSAGCHDPIAYSSKRGTTLAKLNAAIANPNRPMQFLAANLTMDQRQKIVDALNDTNVTDLVSPPVLGTGNFVRSKLNLLFRDRKDKKGSQAKDVGSTVRRMIKNELFGGNCTQHSDERCESAVKRKTNSPSMNALRMAYLRNTCQRLSGEQRNVVAALGNLNIDYASSPSRAKLRRVATAFVDRPISNGTVKALMDLHAAAQKAGWKKIDAWKLTLALLCDSALFEVR